MRPNISRSGGKSKLLKVILPLIPEHEIYVEPIEIKEIIVMNY